MSIASAMAEGASTPNKYFTHSAAILQQKATASGKVLDTNGEPLIGVTIMEEAKWNCNRTRWQFLSQHDEKQCDA